jgi:uncharacterized damage-inducible protein DinB
MAPWAISSARLGTMVEDLVDPRRIEPEFVLSEREMLEAWLEFHRMTLLLKCEGLDDEGRKARPVTTSLLSLHGLVRHMAEVERGWFRAGSPERTRQGTHLARLCGRGQRVGPLDDADWDADLATWLAECDASRRAAAAHDLDDTGMRRGRPCSLRWIYVHMIEEYARHNGHADLIREMVDGEVGW